MQLELTPSTFVHKQNKVTGTIFGFPIHFEDWAYKTILWTGAKNTNKDAEVGKKPANERNGTDMLANINFDFTERKYTVTYFGIGDLFSKVGGMRASVLPIINLVIPFLSLWFLMMLADTIVWSADVRHIEELVNFIKTCQKQLLLIRFAA